MARGGVGPGRDGVGPAAAHGLQGALRLLSGVAAGPVGGAHSPLRFEEVSFPTGSPARLNMRTHLEEASAATAGSALLEGGAGSTEWVSSSLERVGRAVLEDADTGERCVSIMAPSRAELVPWGCTHPEPWGTGTQWTSRIIGR